MRYPNYTYIAGIYDPLSKLVFGNSLEQARTMFLDKINEGSKVLVIGGGTGAVLKNLDRLGIALKISFVDLSDAMLRRAKIISVDNLEVTFFKEDLLKHAEFDYDVIINQFFLDQFNQHGIQQVLHKLKNLLVADGIIIQTDFLQPPSYLKRWRNRLMLAFFNLTANIKNVIFMDYKVQYHNAGFCLGETSMIGNDILSCIYSHRDI